MYNFSAKLKFSPAMDFQLSLQYQLGEFRSKLWRILTKQTVKTSIFASYYLYGKSSVGKHKIELQT